VLKIYNRPLPKQEGAKAEEQKGNSNGTPE
jgi:hypothetical protein